MSPQGISEPISDVSTTHDRTAESERFERIEAARRRGARDQSRRHPPSPSRPRPGNPESDEDRTVGTRLDVMA